MVEASKVSNSETLIDDGEELNSDAGSNSSNSEEAEPAENNDAGSSDITTPPTEDSKDNTDPAVAPSGRIKKKLAYLDEYVLKSEEIDEYSLAIYSRPVDPVKYEDDVKDSKWVQAMEAEINAIEQTWELTRPDLMYYVCLASRYMEKPTSEHLMAIKKIMRYLKRTTDTGIMYCKAGNLKLKGHADNKYADDKDIRKITGAMYSFLGVELYRGPQRSKLL